MRDRLRTPFVALLIVVALVATSSAKDFSLPKAEPATTYPAHDNHPMEKVAIAADPYDVPEKQQKVFKSDFLGHSLLPVFVVFTNDSDQPVSLGAMKMQLVTRDKAKATPAETEDLYRRFTSTSKMRDESSGAKRIPVPVPLPKSRKNPVSKDTAQEIDQSMFLAKVVEPHSTKAGFVYFDIGDLKNPVSGANLFVTGVRDANGQDLMYFEIPFDKYVSAK